MRLVSQYALLQQKRADQQGLAESLHACEKDIRKMTERVTQIIDETDSPFPF